MSTRNQWIHGLQWGSCAWLGYIIFHTLPTAVKYWEPIQVGMAAVWILSAAAIFGGSRWARGILGVAIVAQVIYGTVDAITFADTPDVPFVLRYFLPMCLPLLPLFWCGAEQPRIILAMLALGRWREAWAEFGGGRAWIAAVVGMGLVSTNRAAWNVLFDLEAGRADPFSLFFPVVWFGIAAAATWAINRREPAME